MGYLRVAAMARPSQMMSRRQQLRHFGRWYGWGVRSEAVPFRNPVPPPTYEGIMVTTTGPADRWHGNCIRITATVGLDERTRMTTLQQGGITMEKSIRTLLLALCGTALLLSLPAGTFAQEGEEEAPVSPGNCALCTPHADFPDGVCLPNRWGATDCNYRDAGKCRMTGDVCNPEDDSPEQALAVPDGDRLVIPADGGDVVAVRLEDNTIGRWTCNGQLSAAYRDVGNGVIVELLQVQLAPYKSRYTFDAYYSMILAIHS